MPKVLLVDDEPNVRWTMSEFLGRAGFEVLSAADYDGALAIVDQTDVDVAVLDVLLPRKSGIELLREIHGRKPYVPVIMITADPDLSRVPEIVREGAYDFMAKPVLKAALVNAVSRAFDKKRLIDEKKRLEDQVKQHAYELERLVAERTSQLAEAHNFLNTVLDSSTEYAIIAVDEEERIKLFNRGAELMFGYKVEEVLHTPARRLCVNMTGLENLPLIAPMNEAEIADRRPLENDLLRADGSTFVGSLTITPIRKPGAPVLGHLVIVRDLTVERRREEALQQMQARLAHNEKIAALGRAAAQVAHEVKNPLAGMSLYSLHLKKKVEDRLDKSELEVLDKIIGCINHLSDMVERVLDFARPVRLVRGRTELNRIVGEAIQMLEPQMVSHGIEKKLSLCESNPEGMYDAAAIRSVLINLILNAIQAMRQGGTLAVTTEADGERLRVTIDDTGCGMTAEQVKEIFEPFYTTKSQGLGLGMPYAKKIVEEHGGLIMVESTPGKGTHTEITLPLKAGKAHAIQQDSRS